LGIGVGIGVGMGVWVGVGFDAADLARVALPRQVAHLVRVRVRVRGGVGVKVRVRGVRVRVTLRVLRSQQVSSSCRSTPLISPGLG